MLPSDFPKTDSCGLTGAVWRHRIGSEPAVDADEVTSSEDLEEVLVTGIRYSIKRSMDLKQSDDGVMDAITAEDMGAFLIPTLLNLQRITGVSIGASAAKVSTSPFMSLVRPSIWSC